MTAEIGDFLNARLAEDKRAANGSRPFDADAYAMFMAVGDVSFHRHFDKDRVLCEIEAKRAIVDAYLPPGTDPHPGLPCINFDGQDPADYTRHDTCSRHLAASKRLLHFDYVLRLLALPYADHADYQETWRPQGG